jgi:hypothetical protein
MITSILCKNYLAECRSAGADPDISIKRATAIMAVCSALITLEMRLARFDAVVESERKKPS